MADLDYIIHQLRSEIKCDGEGKCFYNQKHELPKNGGLYFLVNSGVIIYIGISKNINKRWKNHHVNLTNYLFSNLSIYYFCMDESIYPALEIKLIQSVKPVLNSQKYDGGELIKLPKVCNNVVREYSKALATQYIRAILKHHRDFTIINLEDDLIFAQTLVDKSEMFGKLIFPLIVPIAKALKAFIVQDSILIKVSLQGVEIEEVPSIIYEKAEVFRSFDLAFRPLIESHILQTQSTLEGAENV